MIRFEIHPDPIPVPKIANVYRLNVKSMSGDADHYDENDIYGPYDKIVPYIRLIHAACLCGYDKIYPNKLREHFARLGISEDDYERYTDMIGYDVTCPDVLAVPDQIKVTWFNTHGHECPCTIHWNDECHKWLNEYDFEKVPLEAT